MGTDTAEEQVGTPGVVVLDDKELLVTTLKLEEVVDWLSVVGVVRLLMDAVDGAPTAADADVPDAEWAAAAAASLVRRNWLMM